MKKSKKGVTLVELVICCVIIVLLAGACTSVLLSGFKVYSSGSEVANTQLQMDVLQKTLYNGLPAAKVIDTESTAVDAVDTGIAVYFDEDGLFTVRTNGSNMTIDSVKEFKYSFVKAGDDSSTTARAMLQYSVTFENNAVYSGGIVLSNLCYDGSVSGLTDVSISADDEGEAKFLYLLYNEPEESSVT